MTYEDFLSLRFTQRAKLKVKPDVVLYLVELVPSSYLKFYFIFSWAWMLSIPAFILLWIFVRWWWGLGGLLVVTSFLRRGVYHSAAVAVATYCEENPEFFDAAMRKGHIEVIKLPY